MDQETEERIKTLAVSLKSMHLAATMEEALARAQEIILTTTSKDDTSIKVMLKDAKNVEQVIDEILPSVDKADVTLEKIKDELSQLEQEEKKTDS